jgi:hypothetical protein
LSLTLLAIAIPGADSESSIELAVLIASAVPVIGSAITGASPPPSEILHASQRFLRLNLWLAFIFRVVAAVAFVAAVGLGIAGAEHAATAIYTALGSAAVASVGQLIDRSTRHSQNFALQIESMRREDLQRQQNTELLLRSIDAIEDPQLRDRARVRITQELGQSITAPLTKPELEQPRPAVEKLTAHGGVEAARSDET